MRHWLTLAVVLQGLSGGHATLAQDGAQAKPKTGSRWALLVGVDDYAEAQKLHFCGADMLALRDHLISAGFPEQQVIVLHDKAQQTKYRPTKHNVQRQLELMLGLVAKDDLLVVGFSGHGVHVRGKSYLCPADTELNVPDSMVPLDRVYDQLDHCPAALKLVLVDACRNDPRQAGQKGVLPSEGVKQFAASLERPPKGILMLTSCAPGQISMEDQDFGHGVFMHFLLEGLEGKADAEGKGRVSLVDLYGYANRETKAYVMRKFNGTQTPALKGDLNDDFDLAPSGPDPKEYIQKALALAITLNRADYREGGSQAQQLSKLAHLQSLAGDRAGMLATIDRAKAVADPSVKRDSYYIADAQAKGGDVDGALETVRNHFRKDNSERALLYEIAKVQARLGRFSDAMSTGAEAEKLGYGASIRLEIAKQQFLRGEKDDAKRTLSEFCESYRRAILKQGLHDWAADLLFLGQWANLAIEGGDSATARDTLKQLAPTILNRHHTDKYERDGSIWGLGRMYQEVGENAEAEKMLSLLVANFDDTLASVRGDETKAWFLFRDLAILQARLGHTDAAHGTLDRWRQLLPSGESSRYDDRMRDLVRVQSRIGDFAGSLKTLSEWLAHVREENRSRGFRLSNADIWILAEMSRDYALCGRTIDAERTLAEALELAEKDRSWGSVVLPMEFTRLARKGVHKELLEIAERRLSPADRVDVYMSIAEGFLWRRGIKVGDQDPDEPF